MPDLDRLHVRHARHRLDRARDLRRDLEAAGELHFDLDFEIAHQHQRYVAVAIARRGRLLWRRTFGPRRLPSKRMPYGLFVPEVPSE